MKRNLSGWEDEDDMGHVGPALNPWTWVISPINPNVNQVISQLSYHQINSVNFMRILIFHFLGEVTMFSMVFPYRSHLNTIWIPKNSHTNPVKSLFSMVFPWFSHEFSHEFSWKPMEIVTHFVPQGGHMEPDLSSTQAFCEVWSRVVNIWGRYMNYN